MWCLIVPARLKGETDTSTVGRRKENTSPSVCSALRREAVRREREESVTKFT